VADDALDLSIEERKERSARIRALCVIQRKDLLWRLQTEGAFDLAAKLETCGQETSLTCTGCGSHHPIETRCKRRWCPTCARKISFDRVAKYQRRLQHIQWPLWLTLTVKNSDDETIVDELKAGWKKFRRKKIMLEHCTGGLWALEVTERGNGWHPHIHAMLDCEWLAHHTPAPVSCDTKAIISEKITYAKAELAEEWGACVGQDWAMALAVRKSGAEAARELLKYAVKGTDLLDSILPIAPMLRMIDAGRTISTFGSLRNNKLPPEADDDKPKLACECCGAESEWMPSEVASRLGLVSGHTVVKFKYGDRR
jgi:hypothetical protein